MHTSISILFLISIFFSCSAQSDFLESEHDANLVNRSTAADSIGAGLDSADIHFQFRSYCYGFNSEKNNVKSGGEAHSSNLAKTIDSTFAKKGEYLFLNTKEMENNGEGIASHMLYLVNTTSSEISYSAQDSRLNILAQAKDEHGEWKAISYLPSSWCGNSYHTITLGADEYWRFYVPVFKGTFATKLRYILIDHDDNPLISNEIDARINPEQFNPEKKQGHTTQGIMDPYND